MTEPDRDQTVLLIGNRLGERVTGVRVAFETLVQGLEALGIRQIVLEKGRAGKACFFPRAARVLLELRCLGQLVVELPRATVVYTTLGNSRYGILRDALLLWLAGAAGKRTVAHLQGGGFGEFLSRQPTPVRFLVRRSLAGVDRFVSLASGLIGELECLSPEAIRRARVVSNAAPNRAVPRVLDSKSLPRMPPIRLLYLSNLLPSKGYLACVGAMKILAQRFPGKFQLDLCGEFLPTHRSRRPVREAEEALRRELEAPILEGSVCFHGPVGGTTKLQMLDRCHLMLLPTSYETEGMPISLVEAMAWATPIIATRHRAIPELVEDGVHGFLLPHGEPGAVADAIERAIANPAGYRAMSRAARARYLERHTPEAHAESMASILTRW